jgi:hypothetical protein
MSRILTVRWLKWGGTGMTRIPYSLMVIVPAVLAALGGAAISAQDKYTVQVPGGLAFSEFKGYEDWQTVSVSKTEHAFAAILANPVMIDAYRLSRHPPRGDWGRLLSLPSAPRCYLHRSCRTLRQPSAWFLRLVSRVARN